MRCLALLGTGPNALDQAAPLPNWEWPEPPGVCVT